MAAGFELLHRLGKEYEKPEFGLKTIVLIGDGNGKLLQETTVGDLLPGAFTPKDLPR